MRVIKPGVLIALAILVFIGSGAALADVIPVQNASFESHNVLGTSCGTGCAFVYGDIPGWTVSPTNVGSFQPNSDFFDLSTVTGSVVAFSNGGTISQTLTSSLLPNTTYTLAVDVGQRFDLENANFSISLLAGGTLLNILNGTNSSITPGTFASQTLSYATGTTVLPGSLQIALTSFGTQVDFDNVRLTTGADSDGIAAAVPEPSSLLLLGTGLLLVLAISRRTLLARWSSAA